MIDYRLLEQMIHNMKPHQRVYKIIKAELTRRGHWKAAPRGKAFIKGKDERRKELKS